MPIQNAPNTVWTRTGAPAVTTVWSDRRLPVRAAKVVTLAPGRRTFAITGVATGSVERTAGGYRILLDDLTGTQQVGFYPRNLSFMETPQ